jgi:hypothetical protein
LKTDNEDRKLLKKLQPSEHREKQVQFIEGTRATVFRQIYDWIDDPDGPNLMWLSGSPGSGKSTIAVTLAKKLLERGRLAASFSFQRNRVTDPSLFWRTIAYKIALFNSDIRGDVVKLLNSPADSYMDDIDFQFQQLIVKVLETRSFEHPLIIVVDALDECDSPYNLLKTLQDWAQSSLPCKLFLTSRPEQEIETSLSVIEKQDTLRVKLATGGNVSEETNHDIRLVIDQGMSVIRRKYHKSLPPEWPGPAAVGKIVEHSAGLFVWVTTALKYIEGTKQDGGRGLKERLDQVISGDMKAEGVDGLYLSILERCFGQSPGPLFQTTVGTVLFSKVAAKFEDIQALSGQIGCEVEMEDILIKLSSVILEAMDHTYSIHHKSFSDFLTEPGRCPPQFFVDKAQQSYALTLACLQGMNDEECGLKFNICGFPTSHAFNDDIPGIDKRMEKISSYLSYSCRFWAEHLQEIASETKVDNGPLLQGLREFLYHRLLFWLEVMSLLGYVDVAATELALLAKWCRVSAPC